MKVKNLMEILASVDGETEVVRSAFDHRYIPLQNAWLADAIEELRGEYSEAVGDEDDMISVLLID